MFVESTNEINLRTISARNLMKFVGVSAKEALKYTFPGKSDSELDAMVSAMAGFPSDYLSTAIDMLMKLNQAIDPVTSLPLADPATGQALSSFLLPFIINNLNYGQQFNTNADNDSPGERRSQRAALVAALGTVARIQQQSAGGQQLDGMESANPREPLQLPTAGSTVSESASQRRRSSSTSAVAPILNGIKAIF